MEATTTTYRITFSKSGPAKWIGHLDVMRAFERAMRRAGIRVALTQGHNPRPRLRFVFPASVGLICRADIVFADVEAGSDELTADRLNPALPEGLAVGAISPIRDEDRKAALAAYELAEYRIALTPPFKVSSSEFSDVVKRIIEAPAIVVSRNGEAGGREVNIRPFLVALRAERWDETSAVFNALTRFGSAGTVRPSELLALLQRETGAVEPGTIERMRLLAPADVGSDAAP